MNRYQSTQSIYILVKAAKILGEKSQNKDVIVGMVLMIGGYLRKKTTFFNILKNMF